MKYQSVHDFLMDQKFREWIAHPNRELNLYWEKFIQENSKKLDMIKEAKEILLNLYDFQHVISEERINIIWEKVRQETEKEQGQENHVIVVPLNSELF